MRALQAIWLGFALVNVGLISQLPDLARFSGSKSGSSPKLSQVIVNFHTNIARLL
jgi:hypothetical protein